jgi:hypothetical protein
MECQLRPLVYSLGLNNLPRQGFTAWKSCVKKLWRNKQGSCRCKMAGTGLLPSSALKFYRGMRGSRGLWLSGENLWAEPFGLWHSAVKFYQGVGIPHYIGEWWLAFRSTVYVWERFAKKLFLLWQSAAFDRRTWQMTKFQQPPFYIDSSPVCYIINFCRATF